VSNDELFKRQIIDAGVRAMALKLQPDAGGSHEAMVQLNRCAADLRRVHKPPKPVRKMRRSTEVKNFLRREIPKRCRERQRQQSDSWGCWVGDGRVEEWLFGAAHPVHNFYHQQHWPVDPGCPA
jgi:hypothetical protein